MSEKILLFVPYIGSSSGVGVINSWAIVEADHPPMDSDDIFEINRKIEEVRRDHGLPQLGHIAITGWKQMGTP